MGRAKIKQELLSTGYCIPRGVRLCLNPVIVKFAYDFGGEGMNRNSSRIYLESMFVGSVLDPDYVSLKILFLDLYRI